VFIRFVARKRMENSRCLTGVFHAAYRACREGLLANDDHAHCRSLLNWFEEYLPFPNRFSRYRRPNSHADAVCWFKADAKSYVDRAVLLMLLLERHGMSMAMLRTKLPGYIVYEDRFQVAAVPFRDTRA
jgi:hypothetical protein